MDKKQHQEKKFKRDKEEKIDRIIRIFYDLTNERGYGNVTTDDVAKVAGVSIGTIYRYFPRGKPSIVKESFEKISEQLVDLESFKNLTQNNLSKKLEEFFSHHIASHRENIETHLAMDSAMLTNPEMFKDYRNIIVDYFTKTVNELQKMNPYFKERSGLEVLQEMLFMFNIVEALVHRHVFIIPIFQTDEELVLFLRNLFLNIISNPDIFFSNQITR
ncbi:MAG: TetR/AcrR family transcriptional regulator [Asgard group archaeon]|nr:TetR/AcrR family transcriptional regulator [Asgard group archaeon]